jgi:hypothetical protein
MVETLFTILFAISLVGGFYLLEHLFKGDLRAPQDRETRRLMNGEPRSDELS